MNNTQYYLNHNYNNCPEIPEEKVEYLNKNNYLAEFQTDSEKENARCNLGITDIIELLNLKIDIKLLSREDIALIVSDYYKPLETSITNYIINSKIVPLEKRMSTIESAFKSLIEQGSSGTVFTEEFGDSEIMGVNLKAITNALNRIWDKIEDLTGESSKGINMYINPEYFVSEDGATLNISVNSVGLENVFDYIMFYANNNLIREEHNIDQLNFEYHINETTVIKSVTKIMGVEYTKEKVVTHYHSFWLGSGTSYEDVISKESNLIPITNGMRGKYDVTCNTGDRIIVVIGDSLKDGYLRADMNGFEIPFTESSVTVNGTILRVFTSVNTYNAGTYNIDING